MSGICSLIGGLTVSRTLLLISQENNIQSYKTKSFISNTSEIKLILIIDEIIECLQAEYVERKNLVNLIKKFEYILRNKILPYVLNCEKILDSIDNDCIQYNYNQINNVLKDLISWFDIKLDYRYDSEFLQEMCDNFVISGLNFNFTEKSYANSINLSHILYDIIPTIGVDDFELNYEVEL